MDSHIVPDGAAGSLDRYAPTVFLALPTRSSARKAVQRGYLLVDGQRADPRDPVIPGAVLTLTEAPPRAPFRMTVEVVYADDHLAVVYKPPGVPTKGSQHRTLEHALPHNLPRSPEPDGLAEPRCVHRLDTRTQGLVLVGRTGRAVAALGNLLEQREVAKGYEAIVVGAATGGESRGDVDERTAHSTWEPVAQYRSLEVGWLTHLRVTPHTGRRHQIRVHLASAGHPVLGDDLYDPRPLRGKGLFLAATSLALTHPMTGEPLACTVPPPARFASFCRRAERRWTSWHDPS